MDFRVTLYTMAHNEQWILPYFCRHYAPICQRMILYDNESTDGTVQIAKQHGMEVRSFDMPTCDERERQKFKSTCYREQMGLSDYVIVVDTDEFIWHERLPELLLQHRGQSGVFRTQGYNMVSSYFPSAGCDDIFKEVTTGAKDNQFCKTVLFTPDIEIRYGLGSHECDPYVSLIKANQAAYFETIDLYHMKYISYSYALWKNWLNYLRLDEEHVWNQVSTHWGADAGKCYQMFKNLSQTCEVVPRAKIKCG